MGSGFYSVANSIDPLDRAIELIIRNATDHLSPAQRLPALLRLRLVSRQWHRVIHRSALTGNSQLAVHFGFGSSSTSRQNLRHLILLLPPKTYLFPLRIPILHQLEYLSITRYSGDIAHLLSQVGGNMRRLALDCPSTVSNFPSVLDLNPSLSTCLIDFSFYSDTEPQEGVALLEALCKRLPQLQRLAFHSVGHAQTKLISILAALASLRHLVDLNIRLSPLQLNHYHNNFSNSVTTFRRIANLELEMTLMRSETPPSVAIDFENALSFILFCLHPLYELFPDVKHFQLVLFTDMAEDFYEEIIEKMTKKNFKSAETCNVYIFNSNE